MDEILRRFKVKNKHNIEALQNLIAKKSLTKDDLILIITTVEINENISLDIS